METVWVVNGRRDALLDPGDRGLAYGDGLFETMAASGGRVRWLDYHLERMVHGCERLRIPAPDRELVAREIAAHCPPEAAAVVKLIITRGSGARGYGPPERAIPTRILSISPWPDYPHSHYTDGIRVRTCRLRLAESSALAGLKHLCRLEQVLARMELPEDAQEGLLLDHGGHVIGGTRSNVFVVRGSDLSTPALTRCGVKGVMRRVILESASRLGLTAVERDLPSSALHEADEVFVTNALFGVWPVRELDDHAYGAPVTARRFMQLFGYGAGT